MAKVQRQTSEVFEDLGSLVLPAYLTLWPFAIRCLPFAA